MAAIIPATSANKAQGKAAPTLVIPIAPKYTDKT